MSDNKEWVKMQNNKEEIWKKEFEKEYVGVFNLKESCSCPWEYKDPETHQYWETYLAACKKRDEEIDELEDTNLELEQANHTQYRIIQKLKEENEKLKSYLIDEYGLYTAISLNEKLEGR